MDNASDAHLAKAENTDINDHETDLNDDTDVTPLQTAKENEEKDKKKVADGADKQHVMTIPDGEEKNHMGDDLKTGAGGEDENEEDEAVTIPVTISSDVSNLAVGAVDSVSVPVHQLPSPHPGKSSKKRHRGRTNRRRRTLRLSRKQRDAVKRHAKNASKRFLMFLVSHVGLTCFIVAYSIMGGFIFQALEASTEVESITHIQEIRKEHVQNLWDVTVELNILEPVQWGKLADKVLKDFQREIYNSVKDKGWDGSDNVTNVELQWTFAGSLLYSVTIITTIGYGHLTPITDMGRVVTMLYAIIGIPITLLCLANIGSFMAHCFRLLWKQIVCKPCRNHLRRRSMYLAAKNKAATVSYMANLAKQKRGPMSGSGGGGGCGEGGGGGDAASTRPEDNQGDSISCDSPALVHDSTSLLWKQAADSSPLPSGDKRCLLSFDGLTQGQSQPSKVHAQHAGQTESITRARIPTAEYSLCTSTQQQTFHHATPVQPQPASSTHNPANSGYPPIVNQYPEVTITACVNQPEPHPEVNPIGEVKLAKPEVVRVPIMVCLVMVTGYIFMGAVLFSLWEDWGYFESSYFCFITLSTIGFGDIVPGYDGNSWDNQAKRVSCTLYLLFGLALLAMCFELIQSECRQKFNDLARALGFADEKDQLL